MAIATLSLLNFLQLLKHLLVSFICKVSYIFYYDLFQAMRNGYTYTLAAIL